ncbi:hypothetical protein DBV15_10313 [Temnothorax longispinosus]|uniref:Uncharacterized protein n=1 Tax=Temnothorax longispinosus TaxID=300112 RepID=A0A4S2KQF4_9HYME|nr:hypothetical protein DBV15_10313 [Temnothorax longispinosus]
MRRVGQYSEVHVAVAIKDNARSVRLGRGRRFWSIGRSVGAPSSKGVSIKKTVVPSTHTGASNYGPLRIGAESAAAAADVAGKRQRHVTRRAHSATVISRHVIPSAAVTVGRIVIRRSTCLVNAVRGQAVARRARGSPGEHRRAASAGYRRREIGES